MGHDICGFDTEISGKMHAHTDTCTFRERHADTQWQPLCAHVQTQRLTYAQPVTVSNDMESKCSTASET